MNKKTKEKVEDKTVKIRLYTSFRFTYQSSIDTVAMALSKVGFYVTVRNDINGTGSYILDVYTDREE